MRYSVRINGLFLGFSLYVVFYSINSGAKNFLGWKKLRATKSWCGAQENFGLKYLPDRWKWHLSNLVTSIGETLEWTVKKCQLNFSSFFLYFFFVFSCFWFSRGRGKLPALPLLRTPIVRPQSNKTVCTEERKVFINHHNELKPYNSVNAPFGIFDPWKGQKFSEWRGNRLPLDPFLQWCAPGPLTPRVAYGSTGLPKASIDYEPFPPNLYPSSVGRPD